ncbi:MarR family winged helix-turn-helix transcriptional regulator [Maridesulfovibrio ferrireducens]|uniref:MarR family winged helix-turn-helix transcriptional regulator n=1 Tax=Maridesulfovibrio ferrireducens TaxID=246191 RepID=UPI001A1F8166|nr:MarR family transcriptional regulator [Maridesulfovibrio ferrireducens]MBI9111830.1 MarR family transcriptional regulator [Maridesulfovibrio ferrireducens]
MALLSKLNHSVIEFYEKLSSWEHDIVRGKGVTLPQMHILEVLGIHKPKRMKELAQLMGITTGTLTVLVDRLESKGFVCRKPHDSDRRSIVVELTESGEAMFAEHDRLHLRLIDELTSEMSDSEREVFLSCLEKMNKSF